MDTTLAAKEEKERSKLAALWIGLAGVLAMDSAMLSALSTSGFDHLRPLFLGRAASTLARHLRGWRVWMSFCAIVGWHPGAPSLEQLLDFLASLAEGAVLDRGRNRKRSALSVLSGLSFAAFKFQLSVLEKLLKCPLVLAWRDAGKWQRDLVKEALPLPLVVVRKLEAAFLDDPGDDLPVLGALLAMIWGSLRWSDIQRLRLSSIVLDDKGLKGWCWRTKSSARGSPSWVKGPRRPAATP